MLVFKIKKFIGSDGSSDLCEWYNQLDDAGKGCFAARMEYLTACNTPAEWTMPYCRQLDYGISEIRFKSRKVQQRPLGYFGPERKDFTFLYPATEKDDQFVPKDAIERARDRSKIVEKDPRRANDWDIRIDE